MPLEADAIPRPLRGGRGAQPEVRVPDGSVRRRRIRSGAIASLFALARAGVPDPIVSSRRFRAGERRRTWQAARAGMLVVVLAGVFDIVTLGTTRPEVAGWIAGVNSAIAVLAAAAYWSLAHGSRRHPEAIVFVVASLVIVATVAVDTFGDGLDVLSAAYLLILPLVVALLIPWRPRVHAAWILVVSVASICFVSIAGPGSLDAVDRRGLAFVMFISVGASYTGNVLAFRARVREYRQAQKIRALHLRTDHQRRELERVNGTLRAAARTDELTGVGNRLRLVEDLCAIRSRIERTGEIFALLELDLDHFKAVNDVRGHLAGDAVLRDVAQAVARTLRAGDGVYRFGGEEFVALGPAADLSAARAMAERIRQTIVDLRIEDPSRPPGSWLTVSVGGVLVGQRDLEASDDAWFGRADEALYRAKAAGRNRVELAA
jgi:diguanylate cyclase (GGDEF)-like protein